MEKEHGYNFEVPATEEIGLVDPVPLKAIGRFRHKDTAVDPRSGSVYQTEDRNPRDCCTAVSAQEECGSRQVFDSCRNPFIQNR